MTVATSTPDPLAVAGMAGTAGGRRCKLGRILDNLDDDRAGRVRHLLHLDADDPTEPGWTDTALSKALDQLGYYVNASLLSRHRTGACICSDTQNGNR